MLATSSRAVGNGPRIILNDNILEKMFGLYVTFSTNCSLIVATVLEIFRLSNSVCLTVCVCVCVCLSIYLSVCLSVSQLSVCLSVSVSIYFSVLSVSMHVYLFVCLSHSLRSFGRSFERPTYLLSVYLFIHLSI